MMVTLALRIQQGNYVKRCECLGSFNCQWCFTYHLDDSQTLERELFEAEKVRSEGSPIIVRCQPRSQRFPCSILPIRKLEPGTWPPTSSILAIKLEHILPTTLLPSHMNSLPTASLVRKGFPKYCGGSLTNYTRDLASNYQ